MLLLKDTQSAAASTTSTVSIYAQHMEFKGTQYKRGYSSWATLVTTTRRIHNNKTPRRWTSQIRATGQNVTDHIDAHRAASPARCRFGDNIMYDGMIKAFNRAIGSLGGEVAEDESDPARRMVMQGRPRKVFGQPR